MVRLRSRYFGCFYCGRRSTIRSDSRIREFTCTNCDATNHLDENGEITDPPVVEITSPKQYATPSRAASPTDFPPSSSFTSFSENIFCDTCLKNQRLFTASLAQYLPDDPSHPDYADLERRYYRFRKDLEKRYPQVCADCADKVESRIKQAGYTAKTDHLRLMMEKSRTRNVPKRTTPLDLADSAGRWLWWAALFLQTLWHLVNVARWLQQQHESQQQQQQQHGQGMYDPDEKPPMGVAMVALLSRGIALLPDAHALIRWSISAGLLSVWWNPHFVQLSRGFTRHLVGFAQWYLFQGLIIVLRYLFRNIVSMQGGMAQSRHAQLSVHLAMATIMCFIYSLASRSIKVDTSPLFGAPGRAVTAPMGQITPARKTKDEPKTLAEELTDALDATIPACIPPTPQQEPPLWRNQTPLLAPRVPSTPYTSSTRGASPFSMLNLDVPSLSPIKSDRKPHDPDAMDWSPIPAVRSTHRALQTPTSTTGSRPFGQSPVQPNSKPFWFKVPPAPVNPARRLRNPPNAPLLRQKQGPPAADENPGLQFNSRRAAEPEFGGDPAAAAAGVAAQRNRIDFQQPSFFAPERSDETNFLADAFGSSFSLGVEPVDEGEETEVEERVFAAFPDSRPKSSLPPNSNGRGGSSGASPHKMDASGLWTLAALLPSWLLMSFVPVPFRRELQLLSLALAGVTALQGVGHERAAAAAASSSVAELAGHALNALGVAELGAVCWAWWQVWSVDDPRDVPWLGAATLGCMLGQQAWAFYKQ
ncbi:Integral inner nuclear membrane protein ima1 [Escovopsis weberi]|uniref:Integral inner nuclear membrane protein ima1 n=1 Tax=Escovopsis weberi TaxID=150374 RepID=A0A0M9VSG7_ESCWE|nr:Integral inner nuclear membrane protein ima1 [Escovopsis weberi]